MRMLVAAVLLGLSPTAAHAWPGIGAIAGSWQGCFDGDSETLHIAGNGYISATNGDDEDVLKTFCDMYKRAGKARYMPETVVFFCPYVQDDGSVDTSDQTPLFMRLLEKDVLAIRDDAGDEDVYIFHRQGKPGVSCSRERGMHAFLERLRKRRR